MKLTVNNSLTALLVIVIISFTNCKEKKQPDNNSKNLSKSGVVITGISNDKGLLKNINLISHSDSYDLINNRTTEVINDSTYVYRLNKFLGYEILDLVSFGNFGLYKARFFVAPGDSIQFTVKNKKIVFSGKNEMQYNFFEKINDSKQNKWPIYRNDIERYKNECKQVYNNRLTFLNEYVTKNQNITPQFKALVKEDIKYNYLFNLINPKSVYSGLDSIYFNNYKGVKSTIKKELISGKLKSFDIKSYFDNNVDIQDFNKPELLNNKHFKSTLQPFIEQYFLRIDKSPISEKSFQKEIKFIQNNFNKDIQQYIIVRLINEHYFKGSQIPNYNLEYVNKLVKVYKNQPLNNKYKNIIDKIYKQLNFKTKDISKEVLEEKLLTLKGDTITFKEVLKKSNNKIKGISFWASWCVPCIKEIKKGYAARKQMEKENNLMWIYFSRDKKADKWIKRVNQLKKYGVLENQYLILSPSTSKIISFFNVNAVPKYAIINLQGKLVNDNAPKPSIVKFIFNL